MSNTLNLSTLANACGQLQQPLSRIEAVAAELGLQPALRLNGISYLNDDDVRRIAERIRTSELKNEISH